MCLFENAAHTIMLRIICIDLNHFVLVGILQMVSFKNTDAKLKSCAWQGWIRMDYVTPLLGDFGEDLRRITS